jgi:hypothetical protein
MRHDLLSKWKDKPIASEALGAGRQPIGRQLTDSTKGVGGSKLTRLQRENRVAGRAWSF